MKYKIYKEFDGVRVLPKYEDLQKVLNTHGVKSVFDKKSLRGYENNLELTVSFGKDPWRAFGNQRMTGSIKVSQLDIEAEKKANEILTVLASFGPKYFEEKKK